MPLQVAHPEATLPRSEEPNKSTLDGCDLQSGIFGRVAKARCNMRLSHRLNS